MIVIPVIKELVQIRLEGKYGGGNVLLVFANSY